MTIRHCDEKLRIAVNTLREIAASDNSIWAMADDALEAMANLDEGDETGDFDPFE